MNILFIIDPLDTFNIKKDSTYVMMREAQQRGHAIFTCELSDIQWSQPTGVQANTLPIQLVQPTDTNSDQWYSAEQKQARTLANFDAVIMRKDPPFDSEYYFATHLLSQAEREGAKVFNTGAAIRNHSEKLALLEFAQYAAPTIVSRDTATLKAFHAAQKDVIFKPLDGMGGSGIFRIKQDGLNLGSVIEQLTQNGTQTIMAQRFVPEISQGDKRVLIINGEVVPYTLARIPQGGEVRGNIAAGGKGVAMPLTDTERRIAQELGAQLAPRGLFLIGLDIIGDYVTEINVTSPTCFQEIMAQTDCDVARIFVDALIAKCTS